MSVYIERFVSESNSIESIRRTPTDEEIGAHALLWSLEELSVGSLRTFVDIIEPGVELRERPGMDVRVGKHTPPAGHLCMAHDLAEVLYLANNNKETPFQVHRRYQNLHPFMDGNGRSGRAVWGWQMLKYDATFSIDLGFLHTWYYQSLEEGDRCLRLS